MRAEAQAQPRLNCQRSPRPSTRSNSTSIACPQSARSAGRPLTAKATTNRARSPSDAPRIRKTRTIGTAHVATRTRSAKTSNAAMTHPQARADADLTSERQNEPHTPPHTRGHSPSGDRDVEGAARAAARPPTSPPGGHDREASPRWDRANPSAARPRAPTHSRTATPTNRRPKPRGPSRSEKRDGGSDSTRGNSTYVENEVKARSLRRSWPGRQRASAPSLGAVLAAT
jgi:hypothetical protein